jgi:2-hydroxy-3-keto-5-methylthiopentenyl-1-phosphate phosphatase
MKLERAKKILVQCDFDGTVTIDDISFMLLDAFAKGDWHVINQEYADGKISVGQFNERAFGLVRASKKDMLSYIERRVVIRPGFDEFIAVCRKKGFRLVIVSNGLDFYIKKIFVDRGLAELEYHASETRFHANKLKVRYVGPDGSVVDSGFKEKFVEEYIRENYQVVYIGNGTSDLSPAKGAHRVFATESLLENCRLTGLACIPFLSFYEINHVLDSW